MDTTPPPLNFDYQPGFEIAIKHKEAIRQLYSFAGKLVKELIDRYKLSKSLIVHILLYKHPKHAQPIQTGRLA
jgi:Mor family transcriptional regulator